MGNVGVAVADDANAMFWNPAGLAFQKNTQVGLTHANWLPEFDAGLFYEYFVATHHVEDVGTFGGNVTYLNLGEIEVRDEGNNVLDVARSFEIAVGGSYARQLGERFGVGTNLRVIYSKLSPDNLDLDGDAQTDVESGSASTFAFDLAGLYRSPSFALAGTNTTFSAGLNIANMGGTLTYNAEETALPMNMRLGYAFTFEFDEYNSLTFANDFNKALVNTETKTVTDDEGNERVIQDPDPFYQSLFSSWGPQPGEIGPNQEPTELSVLRQFTVGMGIEYWYSDLFALRTGYFYEDPDNGNRKFLNFGAGFRYNIVGVDISYIYTLEEDNPLANTLRFSLLFDFQE